MSSVVIKIKPIPPNTTEEDIKAEINPEWIDSVLIDNADHFAYVKLKDQYFLEALAARFGDDLMFPAWMAKGEILEGPGFDWQATVDTVKQKAEELHTQASQAVEAGKEKLSQVASDVHDKAETLASQAQSKIEDTKDKLADTASKVADKVAEHVENVKQATKDAVEAGKDKLQEVANTTKSTISDAVDAAKEKASQVKENISQEIEQTKNKVADKIGSAVQAGKVKVEEGAKGCEEVLKRIEENAQPIETLAPKHRSRLIELVLLVWLFSVMI